MNNPLMLPLQQKMQQCMSSMMDRMMGAGNPRNPMPRRSFHHEMEQYFSDIRDGKAEVPDAMAEAMCVAAMQAISHYMTKHEAMEQTLAEYGESAGHSERHKKFKEAVDKMRDANNAQEVQRIIDEHFENLTTEEKNCLHQMAKAFSRKGNADALRVSVDMWEQIKKNAETKLKA